MPQVALDCSAHDAGIEDPAIDEGCDTSEQLLRRSE